MIEAGLIFHPISKVPAPLYDRTRLYRGAGTLLMGSFLPQFRTAGSLQ
jgi:hypothetical protein